MSKVSVAAKQFVIATNNVFRTFSIDFVTLIWNIPIDYLKYEIKGGVPPFPLIKDSFFVVVNNTFAFCPTSLTCKAYTLGALTLQGDPVTI